MIHVIHHNDTDGYGAKYAAWKKFGDKAQYYPTNYGWECPVKDLQKDDEVYFLDFSFPKPILDEIASQCKLVVLDHHKTLIDAIKDESYFKGTIDNAGCVIAWRYFHPDTRVPLLLQHIEDWDLWRFRLINTKPIHAMAEIYKEKMKFWELNEKCSSQLMETATSMYNMHCHYVKSFCQKAWREVQFTYNCAVLNVSYPFISDCAHKLLEDNLDAQIAIVYSQNEDSVSVSLRSRDGGPDVSEIAKQRGGGGHKNAAGYGIKGPRHISELLAK